MFVGAGDGPCAILMVGSRADRGAGVPGLGPGAEARRRRRGRDRAARAEAYAPFRQWRRERLDGRRPALALTPAPRPRPRAARHAGRSDAPLRGAALGIVELVEDAYVLCEDGRITPSGAMRDLPARPRRCRGGRRPRPRRGSRPRRLPHACVLRRRPRRRVLAPRRRARPTRSCTRPAAGSSRPSARPAPPARTAHRRNRAPPRLDAPRRDDHIRGEVRATASTTTPSSPSSGRSRLPAASRRGSARTPSRRSSPTPTPTSTSRSPRSSPRRRRSPRRPTSSSSEAPSTPRRPAATSTACPRRRPRAPTPRRPVHRAGRDPARDRARRALGRSPRGDRRRTASRSSPPATSPACCFPASALFLDRPMPPARALVDAGRCRRPRHRLQPGQRVHARACRSSARSPRRSSTSPRPRRSAAATVNAAHVLGRADRKGRIAPGYDADLVLLDAPDWRYLAYHLGHDHVAAVVLAGERAELG